jgi:hypothetical protein
MTLQMQDYEQIKGGADLNYPEWAPEKLTNLYEVRLRLASEGKRTNRLSPEEEIADMKADQQYKHLSDEQFERIKESLYRWQLSLPGDESDSLLLRLITDLRMKEVWHTLDRRLKTDRDPIRFWQVCEGAVLGWRGEPKITSKERVQILNDIVESLASLQNNMNRLKEFQHYSLNDLIDKETISWLIKTVDIGLPNYETRKKN